ncbi:MAG: protein kinase [Gemmatimonadaceae bacterium]|nr:protein kinase [Gemmatimonadaceae bacterium]
MSAPEPLVTALQDRYTLLRQLGAGGMATVYLARDVRHAREVAIKVLHPELAAVLGAERFLSEIRTTASLQHPHILPLFDSGEAAGQLFYVMPYVDGETLRSRLEREKQLPIADAVQLAREVADALQYAHDRWVIHRDIKPENILLQGGHALVADFGIALAVTNAGGARMTQTGLSLGTPQYMAPEQAMGERAIDARADVYALGAVTYEMLAGEPPFTGPTSQAIVAKVLSTDAPRLDTLRRNVPAAVAQAVHHALERLPADRFASARQFAEVLEGRAMAPAHQMSGRAAAVPSRAPTLTIAYITAAIAVAFGLWSALRARPSVDAVPLQVAVALPDSEGLLPAPSVTNRPRRLAISPDGRTLVYFGPGPGGRGLGQLWQRPLNRLTGTRIPGTEGALNPTFAPDGSPRLAYITRLPGGALRIVDLSTNSSMTVADSLLDDSGVAWSDDGWLYVVRRMFGSGIHRVRAAARSVPEPVTTPDTSAGELFHTLPSALPGGRGVLFTIVNKTADVENRQIGVWDARTRSHRVLMKGAAAWYAAPGHLLTLLADGTLVAAPFDVPSLQVTGAAVPVADGVQLSALGSADVVSGPDGLIGYIAGVHAGVQQELVMVARDDVTTHLDSAFNGRYPRGFELDPRGETLIALREPLGQDVGLEQLRLDNTSIRRIATDAWDPFWSTDGSLIYFVRQTDRRQLFVTPADGSRGPRLVRTFPLSRTSMTRMASDGKTLVVLGNEDLFITSLTGDTTLRPLVRTPEREREFALSPDGHWIAITREEGSATYVDVHPFPDVDRQRFRVSDGRSGRSPRWSRDSRSLFYRNVFNDLMRVAVSPGAVVTFGKSVPVMRGNAAGFNGQIGELYDLFPDGRILLARPLQVGGDARERLILKQQALPRPR